MNRSGRHRFRLLVLVVSPKRNLEIGMNGLRDPSEAMVRKFRRTVRERYRSNGRDLPWRRTKSPYAVLVSEVMLQQTQVERVLPRYTAFLRAFPSFSALSRASLHDVLTMWNGLGYNRRASSLRAIAQEVMQVWKGRLPDDPELLRTLPAIGPCTAAAVCVFAFGKRLPFLETNIRTVYLHHFFGPCQKVPDSLVIELVQRTLPRVKIREWYYALMDYGSCLKRGGVRTGERSASYRRQSPFGGSRREIRGAILRMLTRRDTISIRDVVSAFPGRSGQVHEAFAALESEGLIAKHGAGWHINRG